MNNCLVVLLLLFGAINNICSSTVDAEHYKHQLPCILGFPGPKGEKGFPGESGLAGMPGLPGLKGGPATIDCPNAPDSHARVDRAVHSDQAQACRGRPGAPGEPGDKGVRGYPGRFGVKGLPGVNVCKDTSTTTYTLIKKRSVSEPAGFSRFNELNASYPPIGPPGFPGERGPPGQKGESGYVGLPGPQGHSG